MTKLRVVAYEDKDTKCWIAQCLEHDICAWGSDLIEMQENLLATLNAEANFTLQAHGKAFSGIPEAPLEFFQRWERCQWHPTPDVSIAIGNNGLKLSDFTDQLAICAA